MKWKCKFDFNELKLDIHMMYERDLNFDQIRRFCHDCTNVVGLVFIKKLITPNTSMITQNTGVITQNTGVITQNTGVITQNTGGVHISGTITFFVSVAEKI